MVERIKPAHASLTRQPTGAAPDHPTVVLVDGSALYLAARALHEGRQLNYHGLVKVLTSGVGWLQAPGPGSNATWVMWTSASPQNAGQIRFLEFAENELLWEVRRFDPANSSIIDPETALDASPATRARLVRFDSHIAFAIGRLAATHQIVVLSDSFALAQPLLLSQQVGAAVRCPPPTLAFFGRSLDPRWQSVLRRGANGGIRYIDLDDSEEDLFGSKPIQEAGRTVSSNGMIF